MSELPLPDPPLSNGSVALRPFQVTDVPALARACRDPAIVRYAVAIASRDLDWDARTWLTGVEASRRAGLRLELAVVSCESGELLGSIALSNIVREHRRAMVSFWVVPEARGQGVAARTLRLLAGWAFESLALALARLELFVEPENVASQRVAERCGFVREGLLRSRFVSHGQRRDSVVFGLLAGELR